MKVITLILTLLLVACGQPENSTVQVLVGGKLLDGKSNTPVDHPIIVIEDGKITAAGSQVHVPVPRGSHKTNTAGFTIRPSNEGKTIEVGQPANLELVDGSGAVVRKMIAGNWQ